MKMKKTILALSTLTIIFTSCAQDKPTDNNTKVEVNKEAPVKPEHVKISYKELQGNIAKTMQNDFAYKETESTKQAIAILRETNNVLNYIAKEKDKKAVAQLYLDNADYQLQLADAMGYGKKDKEYKELAEAIKALKQSITDDKESKGQFENLTEKIKNFKERLFFKKRQNTKRDTTKVDSVKTK